MVEELLPPLTCSCAFTFELCITGLTFKSLCSWKQELQELLDDVMIINSENDGGRDQQM